MPVRVHLTGISGSKLSHIYVGKYDLHNTPVAVVVTVGNSSCVVELLHHMQATDFNRYSPKHPSIMFIPYNLALQ